MRFVPCSKCDGEKRDERGNPCIDCAGLGHYPHWKNRTIGEIESNLDETRKVLDEEIANYDAAVIRAMDAPESGLSKAKIDVELAREVVAYWQYQITELEAELSHARKAAERKQ